MKKLLCIVGPTATGKTDLGLLLAKEFNGELIACDSRQVYTGLDIGTGKLPGKEVAFQKHARVWIIEEVPVWLYDVVAPAFQYDVWQYVQGAKEVIADIVSRGKLPIIVGGTGLYLKGLLQGFDQMEIPVDLSLREELELLSLEEIHRRLEQLNQEYFSQLSHAELHNKRRLIRKIEIEVLKDQVKEKLFSQGIESEFSVLKIGLETEREILYRRIDERVEKRMLLGMLEEGERIHQEGITFERMRQLGLEYGMIADYMEGKIETEVGFVQKLQFRIHQYAKRQLTWFKADPTILWFDILEKGFQRKVEEKVADWYNRGK